MGKPEYCIVLSLDAVGSRDFEFLKKQPNIKELLQQASYSEEVMSVYPSITYPAHTSIVTGHFPNAHGIINNTKLQPFIKKPDWYWIRKAVQKKTLYEEAEKNGIRTAALLWPVTGGAHISWNLPEILPNRPWQNQVSVLIKNGTIHYELDLNKKFGYKGRCWITKHFKDVWCASPLYDWTTQDVWHANYVFDYDYNRLYDLYYKAGLKVSQMRVASPFNDYSKDSLNLYRVIDPQIWVKLVGRVKGANFGAIYGRTKAMGYRNITLPEGHTWKSYTMFLLDTLPIRLRNNYVKKFNTSIKFWHETGGGLDEEVIQELEEHGYQIKRNGVSNYTLSKKSRIVFLGKIPDDTDDIKTTKDIPSWKRMCCCILKNDHICRSMGFGMTRDQQRRIDAIRHKYKSVEEMNYGV